MNESLFSIGLRRLVSQGEESGSMSKVQSLPNGKTPRKSFHHLFSREELVHYGLAALVYVFLGVLLKGIVLNWIVGPMFIVVWMWCVPPLVERWRGRTK